MSAILPGLSAVRVRSTARHAIHLQFDISANTLEIKSGTKSKVYSLKFCWLYAKAVKKTNNPFKTRKSVRIFSWRLRTRTQRARSQRLASPDSPRSSLRWSALVRTFLAQLPVLLYCDKTMFFNDRMLIAFGSFEFEWRLAPVRFSFIVNSLFILLLIYFHSCLSLQTSIQKF
jgi:hypothetical protein